MSNFKLLSVFLLLFVSIVLLAPGGAGAVAPLEYEDLYDPLDLKSFNLEMTEADYDFILHDSTMDIYRPALLSVDGESPIMVGARRKSADSFPLDDPANPEKISFKIDINEYHDSDNDACDPGDYHSFDNPVCVGSWRGVKKLSIENGDDNNVVTEGLAWYLHNLAAKESGLAYTTGRFAWITMDIDLIEVTDDLGNSLDDYSFYNGVFVSVEHRDGNFLENQGLEAASGDTWLYKYSDPYSPDIKEGPEDANDDPIDSPTYDLLNIKPFQECTRGCDTQPTGDAFITLLNDNINMEGMLTFGAVSAFHLSPDDLFSKGKNFYFVDYSDLNMKREYVEWDLDAAFSGKDYTEDIYNIGDRKFGAYEDLIIDNPTFNAQYSEIMQTLLDGPFTATRFNADLVAFETLLTPALEADPHNALGDPVPEYFSDLRTWLGNRIDNVQDQLPTDPPGESDPIVVSDLSGSSVPARKKWNATAAISVSPAVDGAEVSGSWSSGGSDTCVTSGGACSISENNLKSDVSSVTFTVDDIVLDGTYYDAANPNNVDSVVISRP